MLSNPVKFYRKKQSRAKDNKTNIKEIKSAICKEKYLTNRNLSIMTDKYIESDVVDDICLRQKKHVDNRTSISSSTSSQDSYVLIACEEVPVVSNDINWEYVDYHDITESIQSNSTAKRYCSPKCSSAWFLKIRREILKNCCNKIYPVLTNG